MMGFGDEIPKQVWAAAQRFQIHLKKVVSEQAAKRPTIETGLLCKACIQTQNQTTKKDREKKNMIALGSDHAGLPLKREIIALLERMNLPYHDYGTYTEDSCDYAVFAQRAAQAVASGECDRGILCCGTGIGISIAANKVKGIRCAACSDCYSAKMTRKHNDANMLAMGARVVGSELGQMIAEIFLTTEFEGGRHQRRIDQIAAIERGETL